MSDEQKPDETPTYVYEFQRAMRDCRQRVQERQLERDVPRDSVGKLGE
jgi:hypothetical protein